MNIKKLLLTGVLVLCASPFAFADEIGTGYHDTGTQDARMTTKAAASDEIGTGTPKATAGDEIGTGSEIEALLAWWSMMLQTL